MYIYISQLIFPFTPKWHSSPSRENIRTRRQFNICTYKKAHHQLYGCASISAYSVKMHCFFTQGSDG